MNSPTPPTLSTLPKLLQTAIDFANAHENPNNRDLAQPDGGLFKLDPPPWNRLYGPVSPRGPVSGVIRQGGEIVARWGEPDRADYTFSVAKTYLAMLAGVASDRGLIANLEAPIYKQLPGIGFDTEHNKRITWKHLLQQTSEWEGSCFDIPDQVDRYRGLSFLTRVPSDPPVITAKKGDARPLAVPGAFWEYNDVRINQLALALLHLFRRPLPEVFREAIAQPLGLSKGWRWDGYDHAWVDIDGKRMQSVPGGTHWGGGVAISANDQARIGELLLNQGRHNSQMVLSPRWIARMRDPCDIAPYYGFLIWLNGTGQLYPSASQASYFAIGNGGNVTWVDPRTEAVVVIRWMDTPKIDEFFGLVSAALR